MCELFAALERIGRKNFRYFSDSVRSRSIRSSSAHILALSERRLLREVKSPLETLTPFDRESGNLNVVIETPKGCRNKYGFDFDLQSYRLM